MKDKLTRVNVPELFFQHFLSGVQAAPGTVVEALRNVEPKAKGRGFTRVLETVTEAQWNELYALAAEARAAMPGAERQVALRAAICGKALAERMESLGVDSPVTYTPTRIRKTSAVQTPAEETPTDGDAISDSDTETEDTNLSSVVPATPVTLVTADDVTGASDDDLNSFESDLRNFG